MFGTRSLTKILAIAVVAVSACSWPAPALRAEAEPQAQRLEAEIAALRAELEALKTATAAANTAELERRLEILAAEVERLRLGTEPAGADRSERGMGPAASKVYRTERGVSLGGYGELLYQNFAADRDDGVAANKTDEADFLRAVLYVGYKFSDRLLFNSELEFEHGQAGAEEKGEVSVEFAYLDYLWRKQLNVRGGLLLVPMGLTNELHEPTVFLSARRPGVETAILPTTWRENGLGVFGDLGPVSYRAYVVTGFDAAGFSATGLRGGRQSGSRSKAEGFALVVRGDWTATPGLLLGGSLYTGDAAQDLAVAAAASAGHVRIAEAHADWRWRGWQLSALWARTEVSNAGALNRARGLTGDRSIGERQHGAYAQVGYNLLATRQTARRLVPFVRFESYDTQARVPEGFRRNPANDIESWTTGIAYQPVDQVILKLDMQNQGNGAGTAVDQWNVALGYVF